MFKLLFEQTSLKLVLNMTKEELELITDPDMYIFFEKGMWGGVSYISSSYSKVNNKYLKSYDSKQESKHIIHLDTNNLYGYAMSKFLPASRFKWIDPKEFDLNKYAINNSKGCVLENDFEYLKELRELRNDYPLAPDKIEIKREILSLHKKWSFSLSISSVNVTKSETADLVTFTKAIFNGKLHFLSSVSDYQLRIADLYNIPIGNIKN